MTADVVIIGAGPAGIFTALEMIRNKSKKKIIMVEKGKSIDERHCPKAVTGKCMNCKPYCHITTGFSGAGAFSDGKLSLSYEVGGDLPMLIGEEKAQETIDYCDSIYLEFGADTHVEGIGDPEKTKQIRKNAIKAGLKLVDCPIRHMGTEKAHEIYGANAYPKIPIPDDRYFERFHMLIELGKAEGVMVCQENVNRFKSQSIDFCKKMRAALGDDYHMVFDVKQSLRAGQDIFEFLEEFKHEIAHMHISDNSPERDCLPPGRGSFDFARAKSVLDTAGYKGDYIIEIYAGSLDVSAELASSKKYLESI